MAGIIGGQTFGVAKKVRLFGVRVLNCQGTGIVVGRHRRSQLRDVASRAAGPTGIPAVANMSLGGETNRAADAAVRNSIRAGVTYVVAAGNGNSDAALILRQVSRRR